MADILSIPRQVLHQEVAVRLRQRIVEGHLAPGRKLNERELAESLRVSRTPLREAIKMLAAEGLVELLPNRGAVVAQMSEQPHRMKGIEGLRRAALHACECASIAES